MYCSFIYYTGYIFGDWILGRDLVDILTEGDKIYCCQHRKSLDQGTFNFTSPNLIHVGYFTDWQEALDASEENTHNTISTTEHTISKQPVPNRPHHNIYT